MLGDPSSEVPLGVAVGFFLLVTIIVDLDLLLALLWGCFLLVVLL